MMSEGMYSRMRSLLVYRSDINSFSVFEAKVKELVEDNDDEDQSSDAPSYDDSYES
jgi:hypothetical protein